MKLKHSLTGLFLAGTLGLATASSPSVDSVSQAGAIGVYDSRAIAVAFVSSTETNDYLSGQMKDLDSMLKRAEARGDHTLAASLRQLGPDMQKRLHQQGFAAAPIDDIMAHVEQHLPQIAKEAGVDFIVSKWELDYQSSLAKPVDLTEAIAKHFDPSAATMRAMRELMAQEPVALEDLKE